MPWTTPETFTAGQTLTAASMNVLSGNDSHLFTNTARGVLGYQTLTTTFNTSATHTTMQDTGLSLSVTYAASRVLRITCQAHYYTPGGAQAMNVRFVYGATPTVIGQVALAAHVMNNTAAWGVAHVMYLATGAAGATATFKVQASAGTSNTQVSQYGDATLPRFFMVEDMGPSA